MEEALAMSGETLEIIRKNHPQLMSKVHSIVNIRYYLYVVLHADSPPRKRILPGVTFRKAVYGGAASGRWLPSGRYLRSNGLGLDRIALAAEPLRR